MRRPAASILIVLCTLGALPAIHAQGEPTSSELKSAYLVSFMKFVEWPPTAFRSGKDDLQVGLMGPDPFDRVLDATVAGKTINGHPIRIRRLGINDDVAGLHVLFVGRAGGARIPQVLQRVGSAQILTVSDADGFCKAGGVIQMVVDRERLRFDINLTAANRMSLAVSSRLLTLARTVITQR